MQAGETLLETQNSIKLSFFSEMLNFEIVSMLMAFVLFFTVEIWFFLLFRCLKSSKLWHQ